MNYNTQLLRIYGRAPVIIFTGQSGCGKGTQINLMRKKYFELTYQEIFISETGKLFREHIPLVSPYFKKLTTTQNSGKRQPACIASSLWIRHILHDYTGGPMLIDGSPRSTDEARDMISFFKYFMEKEIFVFHIVVSDEEAMRRILARNEYLRSKNLPIREDCSTPEKIEQKLLWYETDVLPAIFELKNFGIPIHMVYSSQEKKAEELEQEITAYLCKSYF
ncbi:nucleoside monophosphate kinase [Candidatus Nomurabacteria bacterium]|nr:nucleoside monophosphate kinase [Candidatus Nomurabacteria bacterium]